MPPQVVQDAPCALQVQQCNARPDHRRVLRDLGRLKRIVTRSYGDGAQFVDLEASTRTTLPRNSTRGFEDKAQITDRFPTLDGDED